MAKLALCFLAVVISFLRYLGRFVFPVMLGFHVWRKEFICAYGLIALEVFVTCLFRIASTMYAHAGQFCDRSRYFF